LAIEVDLTDYNPLPSQDYLHNSIAQFKAYFGGFGSGKTKWLCYEALMLALRYDGNYGMLLRRTYPELEDTLMKDFMEIVPDKIVKRWVQTEKKLIFYNDSVIVFRSFDIINKLFGYNLGYFAVDQAEEMSQDFFYALVSRTRRKNIPKHHGLLALNPAGHNWIWKLFIKEKREGYDSVVVNTEENKYLPKGYIDTLKEVFSNEWIKRYIYCEFNEFEGLVYDKFSDKNIISKLPEKPSDNDFNFITADIGVDSPSAVLFSYFSEKHHRLYLYDEIYEKGLNVKQLAYLIKRKMHKWKLERKNVYKFLIDPDASKRQMTSDSNVLHDLRIEGLPFVKASNNIDYGILKVNELFQDKKILVLDKLKNFFDEIYEYIFKVDKKVLVEGMNSPGKPLGRNDHLMDVLRYTVLGLPVVWTKDNAEEYNKIYDKYIANRFKKRKQGKNSNMRKMKKDLTFV
jgi:hypothetical protein